MQQREQALDDAGSTTSSNRTVPGSGQGLASFSATGQDTSLPKAAPIHHAATGPVQFRDDFPWAIDGEKYRLAEFDKWLQIPDARTAITSMLFRQESKEVIEFLSLCDQCVEAQRNESVRDPQAEARSARTPETYTAMLELVKYCFTDKGKAEITIHGNDVRLVQETWKSVKPDEDLTWSGPMSTAVRKIRTRVVTEMVLPFITGFTGLETWAQIKAAVDADNELRAAANAAPAAKSEAKTTAIPVGARRPTLIDALRGHKKPPNPGGAS